MPAGSRTSLYYTKSETESDFPSLVDDDDDARLDPDCRIRDYGGARLRA